MSARAVFMELAGLAPVLQLEFRDVLMFKYLGGIAMLLGCAQFALAQPPARNQSVITAPASLRPMGASVELLGSVRARESVQISAPVAELVSRILFEQGQRVEQGQLLVELAHASEAARLRSAEAERAEAEANLKRQQDLHRKNLSSEAELDLARARALSARAAVDEAQAALDERLIRAPFSGLLGLRDVSPGAYLGAGDVITSLQDTSRLEIEFQLPEDALGYWNDQAQLQVRVPALNQAELTATPTQDAGRLSADSRSLRARAQLPETALPLRPGMLVVLNLQQASAPVLAVPEAALIPTQQGYSLFAVEQGKARRLQVTVGQRQRGWVEISEGLSEGDVVVIHGGDKLRPGAAITELGRYDGSTSIAQMIRQAGSAP